jgi:UDP-glucose 4-epimerase
VGVDEIARIVIAEMGLDAGRVRIRHTGGARGWPGDAPRMGFDVSKMRRLGWRAGCGSAEAIRIAARRLLGKEALVSS